MRFSIFPVLFFLALHTPTLRSADVHPPLRVIGGHLYDFSPVIQAGMRGITHPYFIRVTSSHVTASGLLAERFDGYETKPIYQSSPVTHPTDTRDLLNMVVANRILSRGKLTPSKYLTLSPGMQRTIGPIETQSIYTPVLVRDLTNNIPPGRGMSIFVIPAGQFPGSNYKGLDCYFYGRPCTNTLSFTNLFLVTPRGLISQPIKAHSPPQQKSAN